MRKRQRYSSLACGDAVGKFLGFPLIPVLFLAGALALETGRAQTISGTYSGGVAQGGAGADGGGGGAGLGGGIFLGTGQALTLDAVTLQGNQAKGGAGGSVSGSDNGGGGGVGFGGQQIAGITGGGGGGAASGVAGSYGRAGLLVLGGGSGGAGGSGGNSGGGGGGVDSNGGNGGSIGGFGGFGGGGGGGGGVLVGGGGAVGGGGGFGGGGGGGDLNGGGGGGAGGGSSGSGGVGGGGAAFGGAVFVQSGASLTVTGSSIFSGNSVMAGSGGVQAGRDIFLQSGTTAMTLTLSPGAGNTITFADADSIADDSTAGILAAATLQSLTAGTYGAGTGVGAVVAIQGGGTVVFQQDNSYAGGTLIDGDGSGGTTILQIQNNASLGSGTVTLGSVSAGGVLQFGAPGLNVANDMVLGAFGGTVDTDAHDATLSGTLSGAGSLAKTGTGTLTLTGANTYAGGTTVSAGTLALSGAGSLASSGAVDVGAAGTFDVSGITASGTTIGDLSGAAGAVVNLGAKSLTVGTSANSTFGGVIEGSGGSLVKQGAGTLTLTGADTYTGGTTISAGTLQCDTNSLAGNITDNAALVFNQGFTDIYFGLISGTGSLTKTGAGTLTLNSLNNYTGPITVSAGTLALGTNGNLGTFSSVSIATGATFDTSAVGDQSIADLSGTGTVNTGIHNTVTVTGALAPGSPGTLGQLNVTGNLALGSASTTTLRVASATIYDSVVATGAVTLGGTLNLTLGSGLLNGSTLTLISGGTVTGTFATTNVTNNLNNALAFTLNPTTNSFGVSIATVTAVQTSFVPFSVSGNEAAVARNLDRVVGDSRANDLLTALNGLPGTSLAAAFQRISPVQQTTVSQASLETSRASFGTLQNRLSDIRGGSTGLSLSQFNLMDQNIPASSLIAGTELPSNIKAFQPALNNPWGFFAAANGDFGDTDGQTTQSNFCGAGFTAGADYRLAPAFAVGFAVGYDYSKTDFDHSGSNSTANSIRFGPYATWKDKAGDWVDGTVGGACHWYDSNREAFMGTATSNTTGLEFNTSVKYGHDFKAGQWTLTPTFGFDYLHLAIDKYTETGSLAPLAIQDQNVDSLRSNTGGTVAYGFQWKGIGWNPYVQAGWAHEFLDASQAVSARFASGAGDVFSTTGDNLGRESATFGAGLQADLTQTVTANLSYSGEANDRYMDNSFNAALRVQF